MPRRPDNPSSRPRLHQVLQDLCTSTVAKRVPLSGGAWVEYTPETHTLKAERLNKLSSDAERKDFERSMRLAGLRFGDHTRDVANADTKGINCWYVVMWVITRPTERAETPASVQGSLFHLPEEA